MDRTVRVFAIGNSENGEIEIELLHRLQDPIQKSPWNAVSFSGDGEYVLAGQCLSITIARSAHGHCGTLFRFREHRFAQLIHMGSDLGRSGENSGGTEGAPG